MTDANQDTSDNLTKTIMENSINNNKAIENFNEKILELMNDKGLIVPFSAFSLVNIFKPENKSQFGLKKELKSTKVNDLLIYDCIPVSLFSNMITFRNSIKSFKLDGDLLETMTNYDFNVSHSNPKNHKLIYEFGKEMKIKTKTQKTKKR